ncbi:hypothetical protein GPJ56_008640 [Histomonas meleagridis]|uniref:uncharacterized protein n=1 Tax=Histomonas meleagridis TaxID=135588 RepID=UPI00355A406E|nr:hypothetical protein GPJ56_008640 [Histomonas meleagridis]KAH0805784.1 hypothetical protein GO595_001423 [Histomonas meleagridis]
MHNAKAVQLLLERGSQTAVNGMTALQYAINKMDPECVRIICTFQNTEDEKLDFYGTPELEAAIKQDDPSVELLLTSKTPIQTAVGFSFIAELNHQINNEVKDVKNFINTEIEEGFDHISELLIDITRLERRLLRFDEIIRKKISQYNSDIRAFRLQPRGNDNVEGDEVVKQIISAWSTKLTETNDILTALCPHLFTPEGIKISNQWMQVIKERKKFIENLLDRGIDEINSIRTIETQKHQYSQDYKTLKVLKEDETKRANELQPIITDFIKTVNSIINQFDEDIKAVFKKMVQQHMDTFEQFKKKTGKRKKNVEPTERLSNESDDKHKKSMKIAFSKTVVDSLPMPKKSQTKASNSE